MSRDCCAARSADCGRGRPAALREGRQETPANLTALPDAALDEAEAVLKGRTLGDADATVTVTQSRVHDHGAIFPVSSLCVSLLHDRHHSQRPATTVPQLKTRAARRLRADRSCVGGTDTDVQIVLL
jgi:hypothetical protein